MMKIISMRTIDGPNVFTYKPVVVTTLDLEELHERESREIAAFNERLLEALPGLREHVCGRGYPGGFVERLVRRHLLRPHRRARGHRAEYLAGVAGELR